MLKKLISSALIATEQLSSGIVRIAMNEQPSTLVPRTAHQRLHNKDFICIISDGPKEGVRWDYVHKDAQASPLPNALVNAGQKIIGAYPDGEC